MSGLLVAVPSHEEAIGEHRHRAREGLREEAVLPGEGARFEPILEVEHAERPSIGDLRHALDRRERLGAEREVARTFDVGDGGELERALHGTRSIAVLASSPRATSSWIATV